MEVFVFDLDFTVWNAGDTWCSETNPPYLWENGKLFDRSGRWIRLYPDVPEILKILRERRKIIAAASRTLQPEYALHLLELFGISNFFGIKEIYPGSKLTHFERIRQQTGCPFSKMVFFDDESRNVEEVAPLGVSCVLVENGLSFSHVKEFM